MKLRRTRDFQSFVKNRTLQPPQRLDQFADVVKSEATRVNRPTTKHLRVRFVYMQPNKHQDSAMSFLLAAVAYCKAPRRKN
jgi:hypothetical protein